MIIGEHFYNLLCYIMFFNVTICYVTLRSFTFSYVIVWYGKILNFTVRHYRSYHSRNKKF